MKQNHFLVLKTPVLGQAYALLSELSNRFKLKQHHIFPLEHGAYLLVEGVFDALEVQDLVSDNMKVNYKVIPALNPQILDALFHLSQGEMKKNLVVIEHEFLGSILDQVQLLLDKGYSIVELDFRRGHLGRAHVILTTDGNIDDLQLNPEFVVTKIKAPSEILHTYL